MPSAEHWIRELKLNAHPEGGWYAETYRSAGRFEPDAHGAFPGGRSYATGIFFLLPGDSFSAFHRLRSDEMWHFYAGGTLEVYVLAPDGTLQVKRLGLDLARGELPQHVVPAGSWFASATAKPDEYAFGGLHGRARLRLR